MTNELLRSYFLGELDENTAEKVERAVFKNESVADIAQAVEAELIDDYADDNLTAAERAKFLKHYLTTDARRALVAVNEKLKREYAPRTPPNSLAPAPPVSFWETLLRPKFSAPAFALAGIVVLFFSAAGILILFSVLTEYAPEQAGKRVDANQNYSVATREIAIQKETSEIEIPIFQNDQNQTPLVKTSGDEQIKTSNSSFDKLKQTQHSNKKQLNSEQKPVKTAITAPTTVLLAGGLRGTPNGEQIVRISPIVKHVNLKLVLPEEANGENMRAEISTIERETVFTSKNLKSVADGDNRVLNVQVPTRRLESDRQYVLFLNEAENTSVAEYFFRVSDR